MASIPQPGYTEEAALGGKQMLQNYGFSYTNPPPAARLALVFYLAKFPPESVVEPLRLFRAIGCGILVSDEAAAKTTENTRQAARTWPATFHYVALV
jgi:hypothetical protein